MLSTRLRACHAVLAACSMLPACTVALRQDSRGNAIDASGAERHVVWRVLHGDTRFDSHERELVERACTAWHDFTRGRARFDVVWDYGESNFLAVALAGQARVTRRPWWYGGPHVGGSVEAVGGSDVILVPEVCPALQTCAMHELGHVLGLAHVADADAVMHATLRASSSAPSFTTADRDECIRVGLCD